MEEVREVFFENGAIVAELVEEKPARKKRRTKAEMEAVRAAEGGTALAVVPAQDERLARRAAEIEAKAKEALEVASEYEITDQESMDFVVEWITESAKEQASIEAERDELTKPLLEVKNKIYNRFKPGVGFYGALVLLLKKKVAAFRLERQQQQDAALAAVAASGGKADAETLVVAHGASVVALPSGVREKISWKWTAVDPSKIPAEYKMTVLNTAKIDLEVSQKGGDCDIPGLRIERVVEVHRTGR
jgi:hypothetical protein